MGGLFIYPNKQEVVPTTHYPRANFFYPIINEVFRWLVIKNIFDTGKFDKIPSLERRHSKFQVGFRHKKSRKIKRFCGTFGPSVIIGLGKVQPHQLFASRQQKVFIHTLRINCNRNNNYSGGRNHKSYIRKVKCSKLFGLKHC